MLETLAQKRSMLEATGEDVTFTGFSLKAIPATLVYNIQDFNSPYDIEKQDYNFMIVVEDFVDHNLTVGMQFTYTLYLMKYTFSIIGFNNDLTGWVNLNVSLTGAAHV